MTTPTHDDPMVPVLFRVAEVHKDTKDTFSLELCPVDKERFFTFRPGQFNMVYVYGTGEVPISISSDPGQEYTFTHTTRVVGTVTKAMGRLKKGAVVGIRGPFGSTWPLEAAQGRDVVLCAGGIGLAPLRPAVYEILRHRSRYNKVVLLYGTREPDDILFRRELKEWEKQGIHVFVTVDRATGRWKGNVGVVTTLIPRAPFDPLNSTAMICGPEIMMHFTMHALGQRGLAPERTYISMERNMKCAIGLCGHCQYGPHFICKDGPVFRFDRVNGLFRKAEV